MFSGVFTAQNIAGIRDKQSGNTTTVDVQSVLAPSLKTHRLFFSTAAVSIKSVSESRLK